MESIEISREEVAVFTFVKRVTGWFTTEQCARATGASVRTVRRHLGRLWRLRILDRHHPYAACYYRPSARLTARGINYIVDLKAAAAAFAPVKSNLFARLWPWWKPSPRLRYRPEPRDDLNRYHEGTGSPREELSGRDRKQPPPVLRQSRVA